MIHYHVWFALKPEVNEADGLAFAHTLMEELRDRGQVARCELLKNTATDSTKTRLPPYHALFAFDDDAQMAATFAARRAEGISLGAHGRLMNAVTEFRVEIFRSI